MPARNLLRQNEVIDGCVAWLRNNLPTSWPVDVHFNRQDAPGTRSAAAGDCIITIAPPQGGGLSLLLAPHSNITPRDVENICGALENRLRGAVESLSFLVVAPWLSERTRELLTVRGVNFLDLTGNAHIALDSPPLFISSQGAPRNPEPFPRARATFKGPKAGRLARFLLDVTPPYGVSEIAQVTGLTRGYVSRLLQSLDDEALIERSSRGHVLRVDVAAVVRRWAQSYDLFASNSAATFLAPRGLDDVLGHVASPASELGRIAITGSFSAVRIAPVAAPSLLVAYCDSPVKWAEKMGLLPADRGTNVVLLRPFDEVVWDSTTEEAGIRYASVAQTAADCLTGNGRMPSEGEALTEWMALNEPLWRYGSLSELLDLTTAEN